MDGKSRKLRPPKNKVLGNKTDEFKAEWLPFCLNLQPTVSFQLGKAIIRRANQQSWIM